MNDNENLLIATTSLICIAIGVIFIAAFCSFYIVRPGETAIQLRLGKIIESHREPGAYLKLPLVDDIVLINNRICKSSIETTALTKDLQFVSIGITLNYRIIDAIGLIQNIGTDFTKVILDPFSQETIKAVVAKFTAENLIQYRHEAKDKVYLELRERLTPVYIDLVDFNFVHLDFSKDFIHAVEAKQIALQSSITAKNLTEKVNEEALQTMRRADAEAYSLKIKKESATPELIELKRVEALMTAIAKWDGHLPKTMCGSQALLNLQE